MPGSECWDDSANGGNDGGSHDGGSGPDDGRSRW